MLKAIDGIQAAVADKTFADFENEWLLRHAEARKRTRHEPDRRPCGGSDASWRAEKVAPKKKSVYLTRRLISLVAAR